MSQHTTVGAACPPARAARSAHSSRATSTNISSVRQSVRTLKLQRQCRERTATNSSAKMWNDKRQFFPRMLTVSMCVLSVCLYRFPAPCAGDATVLPVFWFLFSFFSVAARLASLFLCVFFFLLCSSSSCSHSYVGSLCISQCQKII